MASTLRLSLTARIDEGKRSSHITDFRCNKKGTKKAQVSDSGGFTPRTREGDVVTELVGQSVPKHGHKRDETEYSLLYSRSVTCEDLIEVDPQRRQVQGEKYKTTSPQFLVPHHLPNGIQQRTRFGGRPEGRVKREITRTNGMNLPKRIAIRDTITFPRSDRYTTYRASCECLIGKGMRWDLREVLIEVGKEHIGRRPIRHCTSDAQE